MKSYRLFILALVLMALVLAPLSSYAHHNSIKECEVNIGRVVDTLVDREFASNDKTYYDRMPVAMVGLKCGGNQHSMALAIVVGGPGDGQRYFGIFLITFSNDEHIISSTALAPWENVAEKPNEYLIKKWRDFVSASYPGELESYQNICGQSK